MTTRGKATEIGHALAQIVGLSLERAKSVWTPADSASYFYFGSAVQPGDLSLYHALGIGCYWRIEGPEGIVTGSEDCREEADHDKHPASEGWAPTGPLQGQTLREFLGGMNGGEIVAEGTAHTVQAVVADSVGGFRILFSTGYALAVFPASARLQEWIFQPPRGDGLVLRNGELEGAPRSSDR